MKIKPLIFFFFSHLFLSFSSSNTIIFFFFRPFTFATLQEEHNGNKCCYVLSVILGKSMSIQSKQKADLFKRFSGARSPGQYDLSLVYIRLGKLG